MSHWIVHRSLKLHSSSKSSLQCPPPEERASSPTQLFTHPGLSFEPHIQPIIKPCQHSHFQHNTIIASLDWNKSLLTFPDSSPASPPPHTPPRFQTPRTTSVTVNLIPPIPCLEPSRGLPLDSEIKFKFFIIWHHVCWLYPSPRPNLAPRFPGQGEFFFFLEYTRLQASGPWDQLLSLLGSTIIYS